MDDDTIWKPCRYNEDYRCYYALKPCPQCKHHPSTKEKVERKCSNCEFGLMKRFCGHLVIECRRYPPGRGDYPIQWRNRWCGEFKEKEE